ncbi:kelch repeat-containing protein [Tessaracoccus sp.]
MTAQGFDRAAALPGFRVMARPSPGVVMSRSGVGRRVGRQVFLPVAVLLLAGLALIGAGATRVWTEATFASATSAGGNTFGTGIWAPCYTPTISADKPSLWYRMGDPAGATVATDSSGASRNGTYQAGVTVPSAGALTCGADTSALFAGPSGHVSAAAPAADVWSVVVPLPTARSNLAAATDASGRVYAIGGTTGSITRVVERFDPVAGTWTTLAPLPTARYSLAAAADASGRIYAIGGYDGSITGRVDRYDPAAGTWTTLAPLPTARYGLAAAADASGRIYAIGGYNGAATGVVDRFDPAAGTWTTLAPLPTARYYLAAATDASGRVYVIGGYNGAFSGRVDRFDPAAGTWTTLAPLPTARNDLAAATDASGRIYAIGGYNGAATGVVDRFDPAAGTWTTLAPLPTARYYLAAATDASGRVYVIGGNTGTITGRVDRYDPAAAWTGSFSAEVWFKTASVAGGRLLGFGNAATGTSAATDRNLYLNDTGQLVFGVNPGVKTSITSPLTYNDNIWHLATATMSATAGVGMALYVDGAQVAADTATVSSSVTAGFWRVGYDTLTGWPTAPTNSFFTGNLDEAAFYAKTLTTPQVLAHYSARS